MRQVTLLLALIYTVGYYDASIKVPRGGTLLAIALSIVGFVLSLRIRSLAVGFLLTIAGVAILVPPLSAMVAERAVRVPDPILGVIFFCPIIALGITKIVTSARPVKKEGVRFLPTDNDATHQNNLASSL